MCVSVRCNRDASAKGGVLIRFRSVIHPHAYACAGHEYVRETSGGFAENKSSRD